jgi:hypothetical protein
MATRRLLALLTATLLVTAVPAFGAPAAHTVRPPAHRVDFSALHPLATQHPLDVTGDGRADLVTRTNPPDTGSLWVYLNNGSTPPWQSRYLAGNQWAFANTLLLGDVTGDGRLDVVARDPSVDNGTLWVYPNNGSTTGNPWTSRYAAGTGWDTVDTLLLGDMNGDGHADIVARDPNSDNGDLWIYPNDGAAAGTDPFTSRFGAGTGWDLATAMMLGDVNGDGHPDVVARDGSGALWIYPNDGATTTNPYVSRYAAGTGYNSANTMLLGDVTGDGHPDIVTRDDAGNIWIYPHSGVTTGNPWTAAPISAGGGWSFANAFLLGDINGDGKADLLARVAGGQLSLYPNNGTANPWTSSISAGTGWDAFDQLLLGDVNGDHRADLLARDPNRDGGDLWIYPNSGATGVDPWTVPRIWVGDGWNLATAMALGDITGDGNTDILVRDSAGTLWVYPGTGATTGSPFTVPRTWAGTGWNTARTLALADVNGDGLADLIDQESDGTMWIYLTEPSGVTAPPPIQVTGDWSGANAIAVGDVDGTGHPDLVTRDSTGALWIYPNNGSTTGDPWTSAPRQAAGDWSAANALLLN